MFQWCGHTQGKNIKHLRPPQLAQACQDMEERMGLIERQSLKCVVEEFLSKTEFDCAEMREIIKLFFHS